MDDFVLFKWGRSNIFLLQTFIFPWEKTWIADVPLRKMATFIIFLVHSINIGYLSCNVIENAFVYIISLGCPLLERQHREGAIRYPLTKLFSLIFDKLQPKLVHTHRHARSSTDKKVPPALEVDSDKRQNLDSQYRIQRIGEERERSGQNNMSSLNVNKQIYYSDILDSATQHSYSAIWSGRIWWKVSGVELSVVHLTQTFHRTHNGPSNNSYTYICM